MALFLGLIVPSLIIFAPLALLALIGRGRKRIDRTSFVFVIIGCFLIGLITPIVATIVSVKGLVYNFGPDDPKCATGAAVFLLFGYLVTLTGVPLLGVGLFPPKRLTNRLG